MRNLVFLVIVVLVLLLALDGVLRSETDGTRGAAAIRCGRTRRRAARAAFQMADRRQRQDHRRARADARFAGGALLHAREEAADRRFVREVARCRRGYVLHRDVVRRAAGGTAAVGTRQRRSAQPDQPPHDARSDFRCARRIDEGTHRVARRVHAPRRRRGSARRSREAHRPAARSQQRGVRSDELRTADSGAAVPRNRAASARSKFAPTPTDKS